MNKRLLLPAALLLATYFLAQAGVPPLDGVTAAPNALKHSDVVFMGSASQELYAAYGTTVVDWGGHAYGTNAWAISEFRARVKVAQDLGIHYNAGIGMLTEFLGMIDSCPDYEHAICRTIEGKPILVPWLWDHKVHGQLGKAYWFCSNSKLYQKYLRDLTARAMVGNPDGYHIDDFGGTTGALWAGGCFCESCMSLFSAYLKQHIPAARLRELGIERLEGFDYGKFLLAKYVKNHAEFIKKRYSLPLHAEFLEFQAQAAGDVVRQLQEYAAQLRGKALARSVNGTPPSQQAFVVMPHVDHYSCEIGMGAPGSEWSGVLTNHLTASAAFVYKCGDMVQRGIAGTASGADYAYVIEHKAVNLVRYWVAESYALGNCFMAPSHRQWAYTPEKGTHWYMAKAEDYADLYQFVRKNKGLFDDYEPAAQVGVLFSHAAVRKGKREPQAAATALLEANIPFALVAAGDDLLAVRLNAGALARFEKVVVPADPMLDAAQQKTLAQVPPQKLIVWKNATDLVAQVQPWLAIEGATNVWACPRLKANGASSSLIVHLLNRNYDFQNDQTLTQTNLVLHIRKPLLGKNPPTHRQAFTTGANPISLSVEADAEGLRVKVPELKLWSVLMFEP